MSRGKWKRPLKHNSQKNSTKPLSKSTNYPDKQTIEYKLSCDYNKACETAIRRFLEEVVDEEDRKLLEPESLAVLIQDLVLFARYQRYDAECWKREAEKLKQLLSCMPKDIVEAQEKLNKIKLETKAVLTDLKGIKKRRRNRRRRR